MVNRAEDIENKIANKADEISNLGNLIKMKLNIYQKREAIPHIKQAMFILRETANLINEYELDMCRTKIDTTDMMPCQMCNDQYDVPSEHVRGVRWEPVAGKGYVYICWECVTGLAEVLNRQLARLSYNFLFSLNEETETQRNKLLKEIEEAK
jgi:hypothetical protein